MQIGILGGTGSGGNGARRSPGLGRLPRRPRLTVEVPGHGSRDELLAKWPDLELNIEAGDNTGRRHGPRRRPRHPVGLAPATTATSVAEHLAGKVVISMANALVRLGNEFHPLVPPRGSVAAHIQAAVPEAAGSSPRSTICRPRNSATRRADRLRRADLLRRSDGHQGRVRDRRQDPRLPRRSTPASCRTPRRSRPSPPCCCSSTSATRPGSLRSSRESGA